MGKVHVIFDNPSYIQHICWYLFVKDGTPAGFCSDSVVCKDDNSACSSGTCQCNNGFRNIDFIRTIIRCLHATFSEIIPTLPYMHLHISVIFLTCLLSHI